METMGFVPDYVPKQPYQSWGTEFVVLVEEKDFNSCKNSEINFVPLIILGLTPQNTLLTHQAYSSYLQNKYSNYFVHEQ